MLVHGAGSGPWVFDGWAESFPGIRVAAVDLHRGLDVSRASLDDNTDNLVVAAADLSPPIALCGWSRGDLVVLQAALDLVPDSVILLEASAPAEIQGFHPDASVTDGVFDPEEVYGTFPDGVRARPESSRARAQRKRGISIPRLHRGGVSTTVPGLGYVGLEFQRSFSSNTLRGCARDARHVVTTLRKHAVSPGRSAAMV